MQVPEGHVVVWTECPSNAAALWACTMPFTLRPSGVPASLHGDRAQQTVSCRMRRRRLQCQCLSPQKPNLSLCSGSVPVHIFGVQHLERQVCFSSSFSHGVCTYIASLLTMSRASLSVQGIFLIVLPMQCFFGTACKQHQLSALPCSLIPSWCSYRLPCIFAACVV